MYHMKGSKCIYEFEIALGARVVMQLSFSILGAHNHDKLHNTTSMKKEYDML